MALIGFDPTGCLAQNKKTALPSCMTLSHRGPLRCLQSTIYCLYTANAVPISRALLWLEGQTSHHCPGPVKRSCSSRLLPSAARLSGRSTLGMAWDVPGLFASLAPAATVPLSYRTTANPLPEYSVGGIVGESEALPQPQCGYTAAVMLLDQNATLLQS